MVTVAGMDYLVVPTTRGWLVRTADPHEEIEGFSDKDEAIGRAFALARTRREWRVVVLDRDGKVETELRGSTEAIRRVLPTVLPARV